MYICVYIIPANNNTKERGGNGALLEKNPYFTGIVNINLK